MSMRSSRASRSLTLISTLLLSTAIAAPAFAQIEEIVVTAQKKSEDIQTVPIAVTAFTSQDLKDHQIVGFKDLQFATPNVTYSQGNFGGANFQIRGLGVTAVGAGSESGVAVNFADVFLANPPTDGASFYDLQDLEVLRGPQSTLYGRGATGGVVNILPNRPDLESFSAQVDAQYGNYNGYEVKGDVNIPIITDKLAARVAGDIIYHSGFTENIADGSHQNDRSQYSIRGSVRWQPTSRTTIDVLGQFSKENDSRARADKELCDPDPTGTLGCTPGPAQTGVLNLNATYLNILASKQAANSAFGPAFGLQTAEEGGLGVASVSAAGVPTFESLTGPVCTTPGAVCELAREQAAVGAGLESPATFAAHVQAGLTSLGTFSAMAQGGGNVPALLAQFGASANPFDQIVAGFYAAGGPGGGQGGAFANAVGLIDEEATPATPPNANPSNYRKVNDDFNPINKQEDNFLSLEIKQNLTDWLDVTGVGGYDKESYISEQSYTNTFGPSLGAANLQVAEGTLLGFLNSQGRPDLAAAYAPYFTTVPGQLPVSNFGKLGISNNDINHYSPNLSSYDQADGSGSQASAEVRFNTKFSGPINAMLGGYYLSANERTDYYVGANSLDYAGILVGAVASASNNLPAAFLFGPTFYRNQATNVDLTSQGIFGEVYYDIMPDLLKLTLGARYNVDEKSQDDRIPVLSGLIPVGASDYDASVGGGLVNLPFEHQHKRFDSTTGRAVLDYTPKLDFTDQTLIYLSYAHGYKAGGFNPGAQANAGAALPQTYEPESIDAYELGTKNILMGGNLQANADIWYYNYKNLQVSQIIDNTSINANIAATLYGVEGEFVWLATDKLQFNLNVADTHSGINNGVTGVDPRNPTGGDPRAILVKDVSLTPSANQNCVIYDMNVGQPGHPVPVLPTGYTLLPQTSGLPAEASYYAPPGGAYQLTGQHIAATAYGSCSPQPQLQAFLAAQGYSETDPNVKGSSMTGVPVSIAGNQTQQTPNFTVSIGAQYTFDMNGGFTLVPRVDYYWQSHMWGRIFHDPADFIKAWDVMNGQITLNSPDKNWYVGAFVKNVFDKTYVTGEYLTSSSSGLYTNAFLGDPRTYGVTAGIHF